MTLPVLAVLLLLVGVGGVLWARTLARVDAAALLLAGYTFFLPWGGLLSVPLPDPLGSVSTLIGLSLIAVLTFGVLSGDGLRDRPTRLVVPFSVFVALVVLSIGWSRSPGQSIQEAGTLLVAAAVFFLVALHRVDRRMIRSFEIASVAGAGVVSAFAILSFQLGAVTLSQAGVTRFQAVGGEANATAASLLLPFAIGFARSIDRGESRGARRWWALGALLSVIGIYLTVSRGSLVAAAVVSVAVLLADRRWWLLLRLAAVAAVGSALVLSLSPAAISDRLTNTSSTGRTQIWRLGLSSCDEWCGLGSGFGTFGEVYREAFFSDPSANGFQAGEYKAHNLFVQMVVEIGVTGLLAFAAAVLATIVLALRVPRPWRSAAIGGVVGWFITSNLITNSTFKYWWLVPAYVAMAAAMGSTPEVLHRGSSRPMRETEPVVVGVR